MSNQVSLKEKTEAAKITTAEGPACPLERKGRLTGPLGIAICCGTPLLLIAAISLFGLSVGSIASGLLTLGAVLACPLGMYFMMRVMMKNSQK